MTRRTIWGSRPRSRLRTVVIVVACVYASLWLLGLWFDT